MVCTLNKHFLTFKLFSGSFFLGILFVFFFLVSNKTKNDIFSIWMETVKPPEEVARRAGSRPVLRRLLMARTFSKWRTIDRTITDDANDGDKKKESN